MLSIDDIPAIPYDPIPLTGRRLVPGTGVISTLFNLGARIEMTYWRIDNLPIKDIYEIEGQQASNFWRVADAIPNISREQAAIGTLATRRINDLRRSIESLYQVMTQQRQTRADADWEELRSRILEQLIVVYSKLKGLAEIFDDEIVTGSILNPVDGWRAL